MDRYLGKSGFSRTTSLCKKKDNLYEVAKTDNMQILIAGRIEHIESVLLKCENEQLVGTQEQVQQQQDNQNFLESITDIFRAKGVKIKRVKIKEPLQGYSNGSYTAVSIPMDRPRDKSSFEIEVVLKPQIGGMTKKKTYILNFIING